MPINNAITQPKPKNDQTRKPLDKLLSSELMDEFKNLLGQATKQERSGANYR